jgi:hypothetical protein
VCACGAPFLVCQGIFQESSNQQRKILLPPLLVAWWWCVCVWRALFGVPRNLPGIFQPTKEESSSPTQQPAKGIFPTQQRNLPSVGLRGGAAWWVGLAYSEVVGVGVCPTVRSLFQANLNSTAVRFFPNPNQVNLNLS